MLKYSYYEYYSQYLSVFCEVILKVNDREQRDSLTCVKNILCLVDSLEFILPALFRHGSSRNSERSRLRPNDLCNAQHFLFWFCKRKLSSLFTIIVISLRLQSGKGNGKGVASRSRSFPGGNFSSNHVYESFQFNNIYTLGSKFNNYLWSNLALCKSSLTVKLLK